MVTAARGQANIPRPRDTKPMPANFYLDPQALKQFCESHRIRSLTLFGSQAKGSARADSDINLLVDFEPYGVPGLLGMAALEDALSALAVAKWICARQAICHATSGTKWCAPPKCNMRAEAHMKCAFLLQK